MRDFSSGQIKKGVRSIGFGGDGATWGNYGLVWRDAGTALVDYGDTSYTVAVGTTVNPSPPAQIRTCRLPAYGSYLE